MTNTVWDRARLCKLHSTRSRKW